MNLTEVYDANLQILLQMDPSTLMRMCQTNKYFNTMCQDDNLWRMKVIHDFGDLTQYKGEDRLYVEQYWYLFYGDADKAAKDGRVDALIVNMNRGDLPSDHAVSVAASEGHVEALKYLQQFGIQPDEYGLDDAASSGYLYILQLYPHLMSTELADTAAISGHIYILDWLATLGILPTQRALSGEYLDVLIWAQEHGVNLDASIVDKAILYGYFDSLEWLLEQGFLPTPTGLNRAAHADSIEVLELLASYDLYPDRDGATYAAKFGNPEVIEWFLQHNIKPDVEEVTRNVIEQADLGTAQFLAQKGLFDPKEADVWELVRRYEYEEDDTLEFAKWLAKWMFKYKRFSAYSMGLAYPDFADWYEAWIEQYKYDPYSTGYYKI